jgi:hypothetical protein
MGDRDQILKTRRVGSLDYRVTMEMPSDEEQKG